MYFDDQFESNITAVNVGHFLRPEERKELEKELGSHGIGLTFYEQRSVQASIFQTIVVYINEHLTELFICGLLAPAAYDAVKTAILYVAKGVAGFFGKRGKREEAYPSMTMKIGKAEIIAPIPSNLSNEQFSIYMNTLQNILKPLSDNEVPKNERYDFFIVEYDGDVTKLTVKTSTQYCMERAAEQCQEKEEQI